MEADSGYIFQKLLINSLLEDNKNLDVYIISPEKAPPINNTVTHLPLYDNYLNKYSVRFNFPWNRLMRFSSILKDIDVAIINQPELVSNFRSLFTVLGNNKVKIISYFHYIPIEDLPRNGKVTYTANMDHGNLAQIIFQRQLESLLIADHSVTCSKYGIEFLYQNARVLDKTLGRLVKQKLLDITPPVSLKEVAKPVVITTNGKKTLIYNHRLYEHYGAGVLFEWLSELYNERKDFEVIVTDPTGRRSKEREILDRSVTNLREWLNSLPFVTIKHVKHHKDYYDVLSKCYAGFAPLKPSALWSMSAVDLLAHGKPLIAPNYACFPEMLENNEFMTYNNKADFFNKFNDILDRRTLYISLSTYCRNRVVEFSDKKTAEKFSRLFKE